MPILIVTLPDGRTEKHTLLPGRNTMGRDPSCEVVLDDPSASRHHAVVLLEDDRCVVEDLGSKNGTLVNNEPITVHQLQHSDDILVGSVEVRYLAEVSQERSSTVILSDDDPSTKSADFTSRSSALELSERRLEMLYELSERLLKLREQDALLEDALTICFDTLRFERGAIAVRKQSGRGVDWPVVRNLRGAGGELSISRSVLGRALDHGERAIVTDTAGRRVDPTVSMVQHGICSALCVPLKHDDEVLGVIYGDRTSTGTQYNKEDLDFLAALARQVTIGLINGRLVDEQKKKLALEKEINLAREIQEGLFPVSLPEHDHMTFAVLNDPGRLVSGDYYDVVEMKDGRVGFLVADVTGKGVASSLLMSNLQAAVRMTLPDCDDLGALVERWNNLIYVNTDATKFITCLAAILDPRKRTLTFVTAGHHLPYLIRDPEAPRVLHAPADYPLGVVSDSPYTAHTVELGPEPCLVFTYTDGVHEAMDTEENQFGEDRMEEILAQSGDLNPHGLIKRMRKAIVAHCRDAAQSDDITMLAIRLA